MAVYLENTPDYFQVLLCPRGSWGFILKIRQIIFRYCWASEGHGCLSYIIDFDKKFQPPLKIHRNLASFLCIILFSTINIPGAGNNPAIQVHQAPRHRFWLYRI